MIDRHQGFRLVRAVVAEEMARLMPGMARRNPAAVWTAETRIDEDGLGFDSLARIDLVTALNQRFGLHRSGVEDYMLIRPALGDWAELMAEHFRRADEDLEIAFRSSGSTGNPKEIRHRLGDLVEEIDAHVAGSLPFRPQRILSLVPPHHIYGFLFTVLLPARLGCGFEDLADRGPGALGRVLGGDDLAIGTPHLLSLALPFCGGPRQAAAISSTAPAPPELWEQVRAAGLTALVEIYGSSETAGVGWRDGPGAAFRLLPHLSPGNPPERRGTPLPLQDRLDWEPDGRFRVLGRRDGAVQVGGHNVHPAEIAADLAAHPLVAEAHVRHDGGRLKAFIVPLGDADPAELEPGLRQLMADRHVPAARPASYTFGSELPRTALGKPADWPVPAARPEFQGN